MDLIAQVELVANDFSLKEEQLRAKLRSLVSYTSATKYSAGEKRKRESLDEECSECSDVPQSRTMSPPPVSDTIEGESSPLEKEEKPASRKTGMTSLVCAGDCAGGWRQWHSKSTSHACILDSIFLNAPLL
jgi:hypothetical protein